MDVQDATKCSKNASGQQAWHLQAQGPPSTIQMPAADRSPTLHDKCLQTACKDAFLGRSSPDLLAMGLQLLCPPGHG